MRNWIHRIDGNQPKSIHSDLQFRMCSGRQHEIRNKFFAMKLKNCSQAGLTATIQRNAHTHIAR